jgi:hypothetical protein
MKKVLVTIALSVASLTSLTAQKSTQLNSIDSVTVTKEVNEMTDKTYWFASHNLIGANEQRTKGINIQPSIRGKKISDLIVEPVGLGSCNENNTLIIKFVDGSKATLKSWNEFDCKNSYFNIPIDLIKKLKTIEISKVYFQNGRTYDSGTFPVTRPRYFIQLYKGLKK